jgi:hypothetical protein
MDPPHPSVRSGACRGEKDKNVEIKPATKDRLASSIFTDRN